VSGAAVLVLGQRILFGFFGDVLNPCHRYKPLSAMTMGLVSGERRLLDAAARSVPRGGARAAPRRPLRLIAVQPSLLLEGEGAIIESERKCACVGVRERQIE
jgi:hypothetical protein